jgi:hypothetical protein
MGRFIPFDKELHGCNADTFLAHSNADTFKQGTNVHLVCQF